MTIFKSAILGSGRTLKVTLRSSMADDFAPGQVFMHLAGHNKYGKEAGAAFVMSKEDAVQHAVELLTELAPERLAPSKRVPLLHLPVGTFLRRTSANPHRHGPHLVRVSGPVGYDVERDIARGSDIPPEERVRVMDIMGIPMDIYNHPQATWWEPVEVEVTPPANETWTVVE